MDIRFLYLITAGIALSSLSCRSQTVISENGQSGYRIIVPAGGNETEARAAEIFRDYFSRVTGAALDIMADITEPAEQEIVIGNGLRIGQGKLGRQFRNLGTDGFVILTAGKKLYISGESPTGTLNGVYTFLEDYLGCRFYSPEVMVVPAKPTVVLPKIKDRQVPVFSFREMHFPGKYDKDFREWHKLHTHHDGQWGMWVHTFKDLVPAGRYFGTNPEYFTEINGQRVPDGQLCLSNPEVFEVLVRNLDEKMKEKPEAKFWSVSQNDNFLSCRCEGCQQAAERLGGESGIMIDFVNRVADRYPDKVISTLAYQYTRSAPVHVRPRENVNIMLCSIECNRSLPLASDPTSDSFVQDVKAWSKLTDNILIWDYVVQFRNYISPFPNLRVLQPNLAFFAGHDCRMMFQQGSGRSLSEFVELRSYLIAKLLWAPNLDADEVIGDFLAGYYGGAAPFLRQYTGMLHEELARSGDRLWIYGFPYDAFGSFLRPALIREYERLFDEAEMAVADEPDYLARVRTARLPLTFAILDISLHAADERLSWLQDTGVDLIPRQEMLNLLDTFVVRCDRAGITALNEMGFAPEEYRRQIMEYIGKSSLPNKADGKTVAMRSEFSPKYDVGGAMALTDGRRGINDYHFNWLGFEGNDLVAVIDLGDATVINEVSADFLQFNQAWIFLPLKFSVDYSTDGENYAVFGSATNITSPRKTGSFIQTFKLSNPGITARYVKVTAESLKTCPGWHVGSGLPCWIFTDEIIVR